jgi:hypothetical protein
MIRLRTALLLWGLLLAAGIGWHSHHSSATADDGRARKSTASALIGLAAADDCAYHPARRLTNTVPGPTSDDQAQPVAADLDDDDDSDSIVPTTPIHGVTRRLIGTSSPYWLEPTRSEPRFLTACQLRC